MKVTLLKVHNGMSKGDIIDVPEAQANYMIRCGVAEVVKAKPKEKKAKKETATKKK